MGAYDNPQRVVNKEFDTLLKSGKALTNNIANTTQQITAQVKAQKLQAKQEQDLLDIEMQSMYSKVNEIPSSGSDKLDNNLHSFYNTEADEYFQIKNAMDNGSISRQEGNKKLSQIKGLIPQFKEQAKYLGMQCADYNVAKKGGTLSSTGSVINKNFLEALCNGGDVRTVKKDGQLVYQLGDDPTQILSGTALIANAQSDKNLFNNKADFSKYEEQMYNKLAQPDSPDSDYIITGKFKKGDKHPITGEPMNNLQEGYMYDMQYIMPDKKDAYLKNAYNSPMMNVMIGDSESMLSEWQDNIPDGWDPNANNGQGGFDGNENSIAGIAQSVGVTTADLAELDMTMDDFVNSSWHEYPTDFTDPQKAKLDELQNKVAKTYIARESYNNNGLELGAIKTKNKEKIPPPPVNPNPPDNAYTFGKGVGDQVNTMGGAYDNTISSADSLYAQGEPNAEQVLQSLVSNPSIDESEHDFFIGTGEDGTQKGVLYHNSTPLNMGKFKTKQGYEDYVLRQIGMKPETIGYFRKNKKGNKPQSNTTQADPNDPMGILQS